MNLDIIKNNLLSEAKSSPNLLSDLAGLENYIAESYNNRSFIELLQNADDAKATKFKIIRNGEFLFVANNGRVFSQNDLESLCRSASSNKVKGETIGYRGIGFKSVVRFSKEIHIISGGLELTFSKERTRKEIPEASRVPLIRIPHTLLESDKNKISEICKSLILQNYKTIFVFTGIEINEIEYEFESFEHNSLIFLRNIESTEVVFKEAILTQVYREKLNNCNSKIQIRSSEQNSEWLVSSEDHTSIAFQIIDNEIAKLGRENSLIHAFLPTEDNNCLGVLINGNFNTDPSRKHLIFNKDTISSISLCCHHIIKLLKDNLTQYNQDSFGMVNALMPYSDPRMSQFSRNSFIKIIFEEIKKFDDDFFKRIILPPNWLNYSDFLKLYPSSNDSILLNNQFYKIEGFLPFIKYLGAKEANFKDFQKYINGSDISILGCTQITKFVFKSILTKSGIAESDIKELKIFISNGKRKAIPEIKSGSGLDDSFISLLLEGGLTKFDIKQAMKICAPNILIEEESSEEKIEKIQLANWLSTFNNNKQLTDNVITSYMSVKRWQKAEEQTLKILNLNGFKLEDISKQNIGFDLSGKDPNGNEVQIEVKSITFPGQKFRLTNNEIALAQTKQKSYYIAVVRQSNDFIEISLIQDPVNNLTLNRQCVQWIWECESYEYNPMRFEII